MRLGTILVEGRPRPVVMRDDDTVVLIDTRATGLAGIRAIAAGGPAALGRLQAWLDQQPADAGMRLDAVTLGPAMPDPGAIYTVGDNYAARGEPAAPPARPRIFGKAANSVAGHGATLAWDRSLAPTVDAECELGVVIGEPATAVSAENAMKHVFGYTCVNDISSRDAWLDGDQWLLGKSMPGFCPVGPWVVTRDELDPGDLALGCRINDEAIQDGRTAQMRTSIAAVIAYLSNHVTLRPGDLIATGTPPRLDAPPGPDRHLRVSDVVTVWIERIGELTTTIA